MSQELKRSFLIVEGDPCGGFNYYGPFDDRIEAINYADANLDGHDWWVTFMELPVEMDGSDTL